jgi:hypothetical protein
MLEEFRVQLRWGKESRVNGVYGFTKADIERISDTPDTFLTATTHVDILLGDTCRNSHIVALGDILAAHEDMVGNKRNKCFADRFVTVCMGHYANLLSVLNILHKLCAYTLCKYIGQILALELNASEGDTVALLGENDRMHEHEQQLICVPEFLEAVELLSNICDRVHV